MDSINQQQAELNRRDVQGGEAIERIRTTLKKTETCFFCTRAAISESGGTRPMGVQKLDDDGALWFLSASDSHKNAEIASDPAVALLFQGSEHADFLQLVGRASIVVDRAVIKELWKPILKTWFTEGEDDPRITAIRVDPERGYYWDNKHGAAIAGVKMLVGAALGKTMDDSIEGTVRP